MAIEKLNTGDWVYMVTVNVQVAIVLNKSNGFKKTLWNCNPIQ